MIIRKLGVLTFIFRAKTKAFGLKDSNQSQACSTRGVAKFVKKALLLREFRFVASLFCAIKRQQLNQLSYYSFILIGSDKIYRLPAMTQAHPLSLSFAQFWPELQASKFLIFDWFEKLSRTTAAESMLVFYRCCSFYVSVFVFFPVSCGVFFSLSLNSLEDIACWKRFSFFFFFFLFLFAVESRSISEAKKSAVSNCFRRKN